MTGGKNGRYILSFDCGVSTGIALLTVTDDRPPALISSWQFGGGAAGLHQWLNEPSHQDLFELDVIVIAEKFNARNTQGFSYTTKSLEPLRCEGVLLTFDAPDAWVQPAQQYVFGGKSKSEKKKRQHRWLKENGFYRTGKQLAAPDADDFRSATAHALSYLMRVTKHKPTFDLIARCSTPGPHRT